MVNPYHGIRGDDGNLEITPAAASLKIFQEVDVGGGGNLLLPDSVGIAVSDGDGASGSRSANRLRVYFRDLERPAQASVVGIRQRVEETCAHDGIDAHGILRKNVSDCNSPLVADTQ